MSKQIAVVGLDIAKSIFQVHAADEDGKPVLRRRLNARRSNRSSVICPPAVSGLRPVPALIAGADCYAISATTPACCQRSMFAPM